jgi:3-methyladenine DNA glycosylase AlkC
MTGRFYDDVFHALDQYCYAKYQQEVKKMKHVYLRNSLQSAMDDLLKVRKQLIARATRQWSRSDTRTRTTKVP